jgi:hypothetical protein
MSIKIRLTSEGYLSGIELEAANPEETANWLGYLTDGSVYADIAAASAVARQAIKDTGIAAPKARQAAASGPTGGGAVKSEPDGPAPECGHGPARWISGISKKTNKPYAFWACSNPNWKDEGGDGKCTFERDGALVKAPNLMGQGEKFTRNDPDTGTQDPWSSEGSGWGGDDKPPF